MSHITDMVVMTIFDEREAMERVNAWCVEHDLRYEHGQTFNGLIRPAFSPTDTDDAGGAKVFCGHIWAMAGNYFPAGQLVAAWPSFGWRCSEGVVLLVSGDGADAVGVEVYRADGRRIEEDRPPRW